MSLIAPTFLFRFSVPCREVPQLTLAAAEQLGDEYRIPCFSPLDGRKPFADVRMGWHANGLLASISVRGKSQPLWCRDTRIEDSDGIQLWIDTRDTHNIHRATRFCHRFAILPSGSGAKLDMPSVSLLAINRARESPRPVDNPAPQARCQRAADGYRVSALIPAKAITGYDVNEHRRLGFFYAVIDRELGWQTLALGPELPIAEDPSLWGTMELT